MKSKLLNNSFATGADSKRPRSSNRKLRGTGESPTILRLHKCCVLGTLPGGSRESEHFRGFQLQQALRAQCERVILARPSQKHFYNQKMNCPAIDMVGPAAASCGNPYCCPWCFVRVLLLPVYETLLGQSIEFQNCSKLVVWKRELPYPADELPFFRGGCSPHLWCDAAVTVQLAIPFVAPGTSTLQMTHVGYQLVPRDLNLAVALTRDELSPALEFTELGEVNEMNVFTAIAATMRFPWLELFAEQNLNSFTALVDRFDGKAPIRINRSKSKKVSQRG